MYNDGTMTGLLAAVLILSAAGPTWGAGQSCEQRLQATGMMVHQWDAKGFCDDKPKPAVVDCIVNLLQGAKGKLRRMDLPFVVGLCKTDPGKEVQTCFLGSLAKSYNDPAYIGADRVGAYCITHRKKHAGARFAEPFKLTPDSAPPGGAWQQQPKSQSGQSPGGRQ